MKTALAIYFFFLCVGCATLSPQKIDATDFQVLTGKQWVGALTYLDYSNGQKTTIASNLIVSLSSEDPSKWIFDYQYPDEPKANSKYGLVISSDGGMLDGKKVVEKVYLPDRTLKLVTEKYDKDNNKTALLRYTYLFNATNFSIRKEVKYDGASEYLQRNEYSWKR